MTTNEYSTEQLDYELARRERFLPASLRLPPEFDRLIAADPEFQQRHVTIDVAGCLGLQFVAVATLRHELAATPNDHPDLQWREWELALAERLAEVCPGRLFPRVVVPPVPEDHTNG